MRHEHIQADLDSAESLKEEAEKIQEAYEEILEEAHRTAAQLFADTEQSIKEKATKNLDDLRDKSTKKIQAAEKRLDAAKEEAMTEMDSIAAEIASQAAEKIVGIPTDIKQAQSVIQNINKKAA